MWLLKRIRHVVMDFQKGDVKARLVRVQRVPFWLHSEIREYRIVFEKREGRSWKKFAEIKQTDINIIRQIFHEAERYVNGLK